MDSDKWKEISNMSKCSQKPWLSDRRINKGICLQRLITPKKEVQRNKAKDVQKERNAAS